MKKDVLDPYCDEQQPGNLLLEDLKRLGPKTDTLDKQLILLAVLAGVVALFGLFLNNVAVIIGAMVISPLIEPIYAGVVNLAAGDFDRFVKHLSVLLGLLLGIVIVAFMLTYLVSIFSSLQTTPEIISRTVRVDLYTILAVILGVVSVLSHKRGFIASIVGVGIAVAFVPPAVVVGITLAIYQQGFVTALQLTLNNVFGMLAGMLIGVLFLGTGRKCREGSRLSRRMVYTVLVSILMLIAVLFLLNYVPIFLGFE